MACATTSRQKFTLFNVHNTTPSLLQTLIMISPTFFKPQRPIRIISSGLVKSTSVSDEEKPISEEMPPSIDKRILEEKFVVINTGVYECRSFGYIYEEGIGDPSYPIPTGLPFEQLPDALRCPRCGDPHGFFESKRREITRFT